MAAYPTLPTEYDASIALDAGRENDRATNGAARGRTFFTSAKSNFRLKHKALNSTDLAAFKAHYAANTALSFAYTSPVDGVTYTCIYGTPDPIYTPEQVNRVTVDVVLMEV